MLSICHKHVEPIQGSGIRDQSDVSCAPTPGIGAPKQGTAETRKTQRSGPTFFPLAAIRVDNRCILLACIIADHDMRDIIAKSLLDNGGEMLVISQFTLLGDCRKGRRPSFVAAAGPQQAEAVYETFVANDVQSRRADNSDVVTFVGFDD